jgi:hypothetical protein
MQGQPQDPGMGWSALRVGPGGVPVEQVRPIGRGPADQAPDPASVPASVPASDPAADPWLDPASSGPPTVPQAVLGSFDDGKPRHRAILMVVCLGVVALVVVAASLWSSGTPESSSSALQPGDCLTSAGGTSAIGLDCSAPDAEFVVAARFEQTTDESRCYAAAADVVLVTREQAVLCLNYLARVGDCLYAGTTEDVGKAPCRTSATGTTPNGLFRVIAVLSDTVSSRDCPSGTLHTLVHRDDREVICLGLP